MERKIGEIFEYNGDWYQCVEQSGCGTCPFRKNDTICHSLGCSELVVRDSTPVIFKKLEKVGEPFTIVGKLYQYYKVFDIDNVCGDGFWCVHNYNAKTLTIEIKQNKEDMEEKKQKLDKLVDDYMACRIQYAEFDKEIKALYDKEESEPTLKEFDLEAAKQGKPVCTRDGRKARIICFDVKGDICPIIALVEENGMEVTKSYDMNGSANYKNADSYDLMMLPEKKEGWVNVYKSKDTIFKSEKEAKAHNDDFRNYIKTIKIEWEE